MDRDQVLGILRSHEAELRAAGVEHLRLFGSMARGDQTSESDVDLLVEMNAHTKPGLFTLGRIQMDLSDLFEVKVDVALLSSFRPALRERVLREAVDAF